LTIGKTQELSDLATAQTLVPFTIEVPMGWEARPSIQRITFTESDEGERNLSLTYQTWKPSNEWPPVEMSIEFAQSKQSIVEYLQAGFECVCVYTRQAEEWARLYLLGRWCWQVECGCRDLAGRRYED
jgi:hypothetical protein